MDIDQRDVEINATTQRQSVAIRTVLPMPQLDISAVFDEDATRLVTYLETHDITPAGAPYARYHEYGPEQVDIEIGIPVNAELDDLGDLGSNGIIGVSGLPGGRVARLLHSGPYEQLASAYQRIEGYLAENGVRPAGAPWETYLVMPDAVGGDAERLQTEVCWPLT
ncbi:MAG TPA: GyrI-like domain-containing protein [Nocardioidaceae bacterium]|nr:GyrI-like domain-containing protein [Nocardioidaceae bacterium]